MSAFDDEFGLFGDELPTTEEDERRSTLGARIIATGSEIVIDEIEPEDEDRVRPRNRSNGLLTPGIAGERQKPGLRRRPYEEKRPSGDPSALRDRAIALLDFLAKGLVSHPEAIQVRAHDDHRQGLVLELEVAAEDLGKVIGRGGRVAQSLRTIVRAGVEGRVAIEIIDVDAVQSAQGPEVMLTVNDASQRALEVADSALTSLEMSVPDEESDSKPIKTPKAPQRRRVRIAPTKATPEAPSSLSPSVLPYTGPLGESPHSVDAHAETHLISAEPESEKPVIVTKRPRVARPRKAPPKES